MKIPNKINICGKDFKVIKEPKSYDGSLNYDTREIKVGTAYKEEVDAIGIFLHEISEIIHIELRSRLHDPANNSYLFLLDHSKFEAHNEIFSNVIYKLFRNEK